MPLHLLGKKSWNVYNAENIARVRRDEARARALEEEEERRMQQIDAERRIRILRGEEPPSPPKELSKPQLATEEHRLPEASSVRSRKRRRLPGEDDTDRDIRLAREQVAVEERRHSDILATPKQREDDNLPITDGAGHINLFAGEMARNELVEKKVAEEQAAKRQRTHEDHQYGMRFSDAAGFRNSAGQNPWYLSSSKESRSADYMGTRDVWGNEDPMRREREKARIDANDPLVAMKAGVQALRRAEQERKKWLEERARELNALREEERDAKRHRRRGSRDSLDSIESLDLNATTDERQSRDRSRDRDKRHSRRHRDRHRSHHRRREDHDHRRHRHRYEERKHRSSGDHHARRDKSSHRG
ncbi:hypothetical protein VTN49DRAFT_6985 [Thermomyces lanuginosus]|uniref:uncharacterized protein n=1 Tax=Thermomyces lanuginosus TaxID=5541 RepID=UPI0037425719